MPTLIGPRTVRLCVAFCGLFLFIQILVLMRVTVNNRSKIWSVPILRSSLLHTFRHQPDNILEATTIHTSFNKSPETIGRLENAVSVLLDETDINNNYPHRRINKLPLIIDWTTFFGKRLSDLAKRSMSICPVQCVYSNYLTIVDQADAVVFYLSNTNLRKLPSIRHNFQRYVFFLTESPMHWGPPIKQLPNDFFNWTMTYRLDSDIIFDYDRLIPKNTTDVYPYTKSEYSWDYVLDVIRGKKKMVAQFVSNCYSFSHREAYVKELAKSISVDVYGKCSGKGCNQTAEECDKMLAKDYLFYLAFENSVCLDYVTEKFWRMKMLIVPIVLRASDYAKIAPNGSYIAVDQFASPKHLAEYLNCLANNRTEYATYFEWTKHYWYSSDSERGYCDLCARLHDDTLPPKSYGNMVEWWYSKGNCQLHFAKKFLPPEPTEKHQERN